MKSQVFAIFLILCFTSIKVNANEDVDAIIKALKIFVEGLHLDEKESQEILSKISTAQENCLSEADNINSEIVKELALGFVPAVMECRGSVAQDNDPHERLTEIVDCVKEKANEYEASSAMTEEEQQKFESALECLENLVKE
ncbi:uncharacterized protein LOC119163738 [Rhipicephalus microplus]|uniref:uncharacterized protein LOC119163738 n=1 Tax=Rhipicephalus microplus TaxID=6941 RepID=UPI003F6C9C6C